MWSLDYKYSNYYINPLAPLHWAAHKEREDIALLLIEHGANILLKDKEDRTPLSMAAPDLAAKMTSIYIAIIISSCHYLFFN